MRLLPNFDKRDFGSHSRRSLLAALMTLVISQPSAPAFARDRSSGHGGNAFHQAEDTGRRAEEQQREQERQARDAQKAAEQQRQDQEKRAREAQKAAQRQQAEREKQAHETQKVAEQQRREQEQQTRATPQQVPNQQSSPNIRAESGAQGSAGRGSASSSQNGTKRSNDTQNENDGNRQGGNGRQHTGDDRKTAGSNGRDHQNSAAQHANQKKDEPPPATVKEWLERVMTPAQASAPVQPSAPPESQKKEAQAPPALTVPVAPAKASLPAKTAATVTPLPPIEFPEFTANEVLAINASAQTLAGAKSLGFTVKTVTALSNLNLSVTKLVPPTGLDAVAAERLLGEKLPGAEVALNKEYKIYRTATGIAPPAPVKAEDPSRITEAACSGDHCYGRDIIGWRPVLDRCSRGIKIGVIDTSIDIDHPVFSNRKIEIGHFAENSRPGPHWHGTGVMGLLAGDAPGGVPGLAPEADYSVADAFHAGAGGLPASDTLSMLRALDWLEKRRVNIVNMSLSGPPDELLKKAIDRLSGKGMIFVAAAGNEGPNAPPSYPAAYKNVVAVTAVNKELAGYRYANRGDYVDFAAPGVAVWTAMPGGTGTYHSGTSFAAPFATAAIAAIYNQLPGKAADDVIRAIKVKDLGEPGKDPVYGNGLILAPATCGGGALASAGTTLSVSRGAGEAQDLTVPASAKEEVLPWLGLAPQ